MQRGNKDGCDSCEPFVAVWQRRVSQRTTVSRLEGELKTLENMRELFVRSGCKAMDLVCMPILRLIETDETREEDKHLGR
jgi:hypothetical protein